MIVDPDKKLPPRRPRGGFYLFLTQQFIPNPPAPYHAYPPTSATPGWLSCLAPNQSAAATDGQNPSSGKSFLRRAKPFLNRKCFFSGYIFTIFVSAKKAIQIRKNQSTKILKNRISKSIEQPKILTLKNSEHPNIH
jgi:hypothetical protein